MTIHLRVLFIAFEKDDKQHLFMQNIFPPVLKRLSTGTDGAAMHKEFGANLAREGYLEA